MFDFLRRERMYIWMLVFILALTLIDLGYSPKKAYNRENYFSAKTFKEIGVNEEKVKEFLKSDIKGARVFKYAIPVVLFIFFLNFIFNLCLIFWKRKPLLERKGNALMPRWGVLDVLKVSIIIVFAGYIISICEAVIFMVCHINMNVNMRMIISTAFIDMAAGIIVVYFILGKYKDKLSALGLSLSNFLKNIFSGLSVYVLILPLLFAVLLLSLIILDLLKYQPKPQPVFDIFFEEKNSNVLLFLTFFVSVFGPVIEEMFFRGFMYPAIKKRTGVFPAALLSAAIFSILHTNITGFFSILMLGVFLAYLYEVTGSLIAPIAVHIFHNTIMLGFIFFIKALVI